MHIVGQGDLHDYMGVAACKNPANILVLAAETENTIKPLTIKPQTQAQPEKKRKKK
jgi:hypothetical protein